MVELKALICERCGAQIDRKTMKCSYCGTEYIIKDDRVVRIETFTNPVRTIRAKSTIDAFSAARVKDLPDYMEFCVKELAHKMADAIYESMQIRVTENSIDHGYDIESEIRVIVPERTSGTFTTKSAFVDGAKVTGTIPIKK